MKSNEYNPIVYYINQICTILSHYLKNYSLDTLPFIQQEGGGLIQKTSKLFSSFGFSSSKSYSNPNPTPLIIYIVGGLSPKDIVNRKSFIEEGKSKGIEVCKKYYQIRIGSNDLIDGKDIMKGLMYQYENDEDTF